jgi:alkaline phosphatase D
VHATHQPFSRRAFLVALAATTAAAACSSDDSGGSDESATTDASTSSTPSLPVPDLAAPFTLGVASGDPRHDRVSLWTRLAPAPFAGDGGMPPDDVPVRWEVAADESFDEIVADGTAVAPARLGHSVHVDADGLDAATNYWYRFAVGDHESPVGRTRTLPAPDDSPDSFSIGVANCQDFGSGYYAAHRHLAAEPVDLVFFLGDYIYERAGADTPEEATALRRNYGPACTTLEQYRTRYAQYKQDADLQAAHHAFPWVMLWDDHEVENNYAGGIPDHDGDPETFVAKRAAAYQAWYEHLPVRIDPPEGTDVEIWQDFAVGDLAHFFVIDVRQSSDPIACRDTSTIDMGPACDELADPARTNLGEAQESWLFDGLEQADRTWTVLVNPILMSGLDISEQGQDPAFYMELWDGYPEMRRRLVEFLTDNDVPRPVVLSGDYHAAFVGDLKARPFDPDSPVVAPELLGSSISSVVFAQDYLAKNPQMQYFEPRNGYLTCEITPQGWTADFKFVADVMDPTSPIDTGARFAIKPDSPVAERLA